MVDQPAPAVGTRSRVAEWVAAIELLRRDETLADPSDMASTEPSISSRDEAHTAGTSESSARSAVLEGETISSAKEDDSEDDLDIDLAKAALTTGATALEAREWDEAMGLLQEGLQVLQQLHPQQRAFCDMFRLQYQLAVCAYYTQEPADVEEALLSLVEQPVSSFGHRQYVYDVAHLLSNLYVRMGQLNRALSECERALSGRRRLLGKHSEASMESTALLAHIYTLLNNRARAKACLAMIPESRRDYVAKMVEASLGSRLEQPDAASLHALSISEESDRAGQPAQTGDSDSTYSMEYRCYGPVSSVISHPQPSQPASPRPSYQRSPSDRNEMSPRQSYNRSHSNVSGLDSLRSTTVTSLSSADERNASISTEKVKYQQDYTTDKEIATGAVGSPKVAPNVKATPKDRRAEILRSIRCMPVDKIEEAVCSGDPFALSSLLKKKNGFLRSKMQKALHSKRVTALHFAALFGEIEMARRLLACNYDINEIPDLSTTRQTPLKFALGARQDAMVAFLISNGAKPIEPDSWSSLAGLLMDRSWLANTMSVAEKENLDQAPTRIIAILKIWQRHGWDANAPYDASGRTLLHQAVALETGAYKWDANLRVTMTRFLCEQGADPTQPDAKGNTPFDMARVVEDQDLLPILDQRMKKQRWDKESAGLVELDARSSSPVELFDRSTTVPAKPYSHDYKVDIRFVQ